MILEAVLLAQLTGTMQECASDIAVSGIKYYSTNCPLMQQMITGTNATSSAAPSPSCPDGYTLMADLMMHPKCAKDIIEPSYK